MNKHIGMLAVLATVLLSGSGPCDSRFEGGKCSGESECWDEPD